MQKMTLLLQNYGLLLLFGNVFLTQIGLPIPALPALVIAGALGIYRPQFMLFSSTGAPLWIGVGLRLGAFLSKI